GHARSDLVDHHRATGPVRHSGVGFYPALGVPSPHWTRVRHDGLQGVGAAPWSADCRGQCRQDEGGAAECVHRRYPRLVRLPRRSRTTGLAGFQLRTVVASVPRRFRGGHTRHRPDTHDLLVRGVCGAVPSTLPLTVKRSIEIVSIGTELLLGDVVDTNAPSAGRLLTSLGIAVSRRVTVPDVSGEIATAVGEALDRTGIVVTTGGLGPTRDDLTRDGVNRKS